MIGLGSKAGMIGLAAALAIVSGAALVDGITKRAEIRTLEGVLDRTSKALKLEQENLGTCHANYRLVELAIDRQGKDIRGLAESSASATAAAAKAASAAAVNSKAARESAERVLAMPRPAPDMACTEAARLLRGGM